MEPEQTSRPALTSAILEVCDGSGPGEKALFHLFAALHDIEAGDTLSPVATASIALDRAARPGGPPLMPSPSSREGTPDA